MGVVTSKTTDTPVKRSDSALARDSDGLKTWVVQYANEPRITVAHSGVGNVNARADVKDKRKAEVARTVKCIHTQGDTHVLCVKVGGGGGFYASVSKADVKEHATATIVVSGKVDTIVDGKRKTIYDIGPKKRGVKLAVGDAGKFKADGW